jgi:hypothetical protein
MPNFFTLLIPFWWLQEVHGKFLLMPKILDLNHFLISLVFSIKLKQLLLNRYNWFLYLLEVNFFSSVRNHLGCFFSLVVFLIFLFEKSLVESFSLVFD